MVTRREFVATLAAGAGVALLTPVSGYAAPPTIEIIALPHSPVVTALKPVRDFLGTLTGKVKVVELDSESAAGAKRMSAVGMKGHIPILLLINGSYRFKRTDGTVVVFSNFPAKADNPLGLNGSWTVADFEIAVKAALGDTGK